MSKTIRISDENINYLAEIHKVPNKAINQIRTGQSEEVRDTELANLSKRVAALEQLAKGQY